LVVITENVTFHWLKNAYAGFDWVFYVSRWQVPKEDFRRNIRESGVWPDAPGKVGHDALSIDRQNFVVLFVLSDRPITLTFATICDKAQFWKRHGCIAQQRLQSLQDKVEQDGCQAR
jgi:hypothetical protein